MKEKLVEEYLMRCSFKMEQESMIKRRNWWKNTEIKEDEIKVLGSWKKRTCEIEEAEKGKDVNFKREIEWKERMTK